MKRIPFTIKDWKAGGVPVTIFEKFKIKELIKFGVEKDYCYAGIINNNVHVLTEGMMLLEVPCTKYYTHYYRDLHGNYSCVLNQESSCLNNSTFYTHIKTVEVEL